MTYNATVAVDFDNTLIYRDENGEYVAAPGAAEAMQALRKKGCRIIIHSCRTGIAHKHGSLTEELTFIETTLNRFGIDFDEIYAGQKMIADFYIDDRAITYRGDWEETLTETSKEIDWIKQEEPEPK